MLHLPARRPLSRREALCRMGSGFGMLSFASHGGRIARQGRRHAEFGRACLSARIPNFKPKAKHVIFLFMNGGAVAGGHLRSTSRCWTSTTASRCPAQSRIARAQDRQPDALAVHVQEVRPERHRSERDLPVPGRVRRRHVHDPLDVHRHPESRAVAADDEHRAHPAGPAVDGIVAHLRAGHGEQEPARLRGAVSRSADHRRAAAVELGVSAAGVPGHVHFRQRQATRSSIPRS